MTRSTPPPAAAPSPWVGARPPAAPTRSSPCSRRAGSSAARSTRAVDSPSTPVGTTAPLPSRSPATAACSWAGTPSRAATSRDYTAAGAPDAGWDGDGRRSGLAMSVSSIALRPDGSVLVGGATGAAPSDGKILRLASDGSTDSGFGGSAGVTVDAGGHDGITAIALQADGKVVATGFGIGAAGHGQTIVRRYLADGSADPGFTPYPRRSASRTRRSASSRRAAARRWSPRTPRSATTTTSSSCASRPTAGRTRSSASTAPRCSTPDAGRSPAAWSRRPTGRPLVVGSTRVGSRDVAAVFRFQADGSAGPLPTEGFVLDGYGGLSGGAPAVWACRRRSSAIPSGPGGTSRAALRCCRVVAVWSSTGTAASTGSPSATARVGRSPTARRTGPGGTSSVASRCCPTGPAATCSTGTAASTRSRSAADRCRPRSPGTPYWRDRRRPRRSRSSRTAGAGTWSTSGRGPPVRWRAEAERRWPALARSGRRARGIVLSPDGSGGWVLDYSGGLHPFGTGGDAAPPSTVGGPYWAGRAIAAASPRSLNRRFDGRGLVLRRP